MLGFPLPAFAATKNSESDDSQKRDLKNGYKFGVLTLPNKKPLRLNGKTLSKASLLSICS